MACFSRLSNLGGRHQLQRAAVATARGDHDATAQGRSYRTLAAAERSSQDVRMQQANDRMAHTRRRPPLALVAGSTGWIGTQTSIAALRRGWEVIGMTRRTTPNPMFEEHPGYQELYLSEEDQLCPMASTAAIVEACAGREVRVFNGRGVVPTSGKSACLAKGNILPLKALVDASRALHADSLTQFRGFVEYGSIGLTLVEQTARTSGSEITDEYHQSRQIMEQAITEARIPHLILRVPWVLSRANHGHLDMRHAWGFEQMANFPIQVHLGDGSQVIPTVLDSDLIEAALRWDGATSQTVDALDSERNTLSTIYQRYCNLLGTRYIPFSLTTEEAHFMTSIYSLGHASTFATWLACRVEQDQKAGNSIEYDHKPFEKLLGRPSKTFYDIYRDEGDDIYASGPPLAEHMAGAINALASDPQKLRAFVTFLEERGLNLALRVAKALQERGNA